ncbi:MAG: NTPase [Nitrososphaerota archaeon]
MNLHDRLLIGVTGPPGCGKTTLVEQVASILRRDGKVVAGIITREVREGGRRIGFNIIDIETLQAVPLARESGETGPRIGRYRVYVENLDGYASDVIDRALGRGGIVIVDEVGPMELMSQRFRSVLERVLRNAREAILTLHYRSRDPLLLEAHSIVTRLIVLRRGEAGALAREVAKLFMERG